MASLILSDWIVDELRLIHKAYFGAVESLFRKIHNYLAISTISFRLSMAAAC